MHLVEDKPKQGTRGRTEPAFDASEVLRALQSMRAGDFTVRLRGDWTGIAGKVADTFNDIVAANARLAVELERVGQTVGRQGRRASACAWTAVRAPGARWKCRSTP
jgi:hypothetical protein